MVLAVALGALLIAPAAWSAQTLGHATSGTFPAGGPASSAFAGGPGGGPFGGGSLTAVTRYVAQHGGGTIGVSSQMAASSPIISSNARVAALGGFSGRESEVSVSWLADAVRAGKIRWVLTDRGAGGGLPHDSRVGSSKLMDAGDAPCKERGGGGLPHGSRVGSSKLMAAVAATCKASGGGLYDCQGRADVLAARGT